MKNETTSQNNHSTVQQGKIEDLSKHINDQADQLQKYQHEIDRLLEILKAMENEKHNKDKQIRELQE